MSLVCVWWTWTEKSHSYSLPHLESIVKDWVQAPVCRVPNTNFDFHKAFSLHLLIQHNPASLFHMMILYFMAITLSKWKEIENCRWRKGRMSKFWQLESCLSIGGMTDFYLVHIALCPGLRAINWLVICTTLFGVLSPLSFVDWSMRFMIQQVFFSSSLISNINTGHFSRIVICEFLLSLFYVCARMLSPSIVSDSLRSHGL